MTRCDKHGKTIVDEKGNCHDCYKVKPKKAKIED
jgi:hypothetical protein|tara:strand:+ start:574 stop:675 length:102 start_codon:yes stop_codon:yes gene_type:complete